MVTATKEKPKLFEKRKAVFQPPRIIINAVEGWGKTSCGAHTPKPLILMAKGETGYDTLLGAGLVPSVPAGIINNWKELIATLDDIKNSEELPYKTIVMDAIGGFESMCHDYICEKDFNGDWGEKGFSGYQRGYDMAIPEWTSMLSRLDAIRTSKKIMIILLGHTHVKPYKNPMGDDFDRFVCDIHHKSWGVTHKWADAVLFGNFFTVTEEKKKNKIKGVGGSDRVLYTERRDAFDAKNRFNMPEEIDIPDSPEKIWNEIWKHIYTKGN